GRGPQLDASLSIDRERALEGEHVMATLELAATDGADRVDVFLELQQALRSEGPNPRALRLAPRVPVTLELPLRCERWGAFSLGPALIRVRDRFGFHTWETHVGERVPLRVYPTVETLRTLLPPLEPQRFIGNPVSRTRGDGIEFADVREWARGDRLRRINWRASARRRELWVNDQHPERNTDVVLFLDTFTDVGIEGRGTLDL